MMQRAPRPRRLGSASGVWGAADTRQPTRDISFRDEIPESTIAAYTLQLYGIASTVLTVTV